MQTVNHDTEQTVPQKLFYSREEAIAYGGNHGETEPPSVDVDDMLRYLAEAVGVTAVSAS